MVVRKGASAGTGRKKGPEVGLKRAAQGRLRTEPYQDLEPIPSERSTYQQAIEIVRKGGDKALAADRLRQSHERGDRRATYALATWYIHGRHFPINASKAFRLLRQSSKAGIPEAWFDVGHSYEIGFGTKKSPKKAFEAYLEAARRGDEGGREAVVRCLFWGIGVSTNRKLAILVRDL